MARQQQRPELTVEQERFVRAEANGISTREIIKELWGIEYGAEGYHAAESRLTRWRKHPKYAETWKDEVRKQDFSDYVKARRTLRKGMEDKRDKWLAMQSAVSVLNTSGKRIYNDEDSTVHVKLENMLDLGSPDADEQG